MNNTMKMRLSGSALKTLALLAMIIDHTAIVLVYNMDFGLKPLWHMGSRAITLYYIMRTIGRIAFPIYCYLIVEGYVHTRDRAKYGLNLLMFAIISEIPWDMAFSGFWDNEAQNVFFTLFLGYAGICTYDKLKDRKLLRVVAVLVLFVVAWAIRCDYSITGYTLILLTYVLREKKLVLGITGACLLGRLCPILCAYGLIGMYDGSRGYIKGRLKYLFYVAYPLHLAILFVLSLYLV